MISPGASGAGIRLSGTISGIAAGRKPCANRTPAGRPRANRPIPKAAKESPQSKTAAPVVDAFTQAAGYTFLYHRRRDQLPLGAADGAPVVRSPWDRGGTQTLRANCTPAGLPRKPPQPKAAK